jgi:hypothetical protein
MATETFTKKIKSELKKGLPKNIKAQISAQIHSKLNSRLAARINQSAQKASETATKTAQKTVKIATDTAQIAAETAKHSLDQVLLGLEHRGFKVKDSQDLQDIQVMAQKVGQKVLERAEAIRAQIATSPFSPAWLKDVKIPTTSEKSSENAAEKPHDEKAAAAFEPDVKNAAGASSLTETTISAAAADVQPETLEARRESNKDVQDENDEDISVLEKPAKKSKRENASRSTKATSSTRAEK